MRLNKTQRDSLIADANRAVYKPEIDAYKAEGQQLVLRAYALYMGEEQLAALKLVEPRFLQLHAGFQPRFRKDKSASEVLKLGMCDLTGRQSWLNNIWLDAPRAIDNTQFEVVSPQLFRDGAKWLKAGEALRAKKLETMIAITGLVNSAPNAEAIKAQWPKGIRMPTGWGATLAKKDKPQLPAVVMPTALLRQALKEAA